MRRRTTPLTASGWTVAVLAVVAYAAGWLLGWVELMVIAAGCLIVLAVAGAGIAAIAIAAALAGLSMPPLSSTVRIVWPRLARDELRSTAYALEAVTRHGSMRGSWLAARRIARCHPWAEGGLDPIPPAVQHRSSSRPATTASAPTKTQGA